MWENVARGPDLKPGKTHWPLPSLRLPLPRLTTLEARPQYWGTSSGPSNATCWMNHPPLWTQVSSPRNRPQEEMVSNWAHPRKHHHPASSYECKNGCHPDDFRGHLTLWCMLRSGKAVHTRYTDTTLAETEIFAFLQQLLST